MNAEALQPLRRVRVESLRPGDIVLTATSGKVSKAIRGATQGEVSHAMICVQHGSTIDSTDNGVQASNIQRELYKAGDTVRVLRLRKPLDEVGIHKVVNFARSEIGTRYSKIEAVRTVIGVTKPRSRRMFCSRLVARAYAVAGTQLVVDPDYCSPNDLCCSPLLFEVADMLEVVTEQELAAWRARPNPIAAMQQAQNRVLAAGRAINPDIENLNDLDMYVQAHPEHDELIADAYRDTGFLDLWRNDFAVNPHHYDLAELEAVTNDQTSTTIRQYCINVIKEFYTGGLRYAVLLAHYKRMMEKGPRRTIAQLVQLYQQLVSNDNMLRNVALQWLRRHSPDDAKAALQRIAPHSEFWFEIVDSVEPRLSELARANIQIAGTDIGCSVCGDPAEDYLIVNAAEVMPGVPSIRLCPDCLTIRSNTGEIFAPMED